MPTIDGGECGKMVSDNHNLLRIAFAYSLFNEGEVSLKFIVDVLGNHMKSTSNVGLGKNSSYA